MSDKLPPDPPVISSATGEHRGGVRTEVAQGKSWAKIFIDKPSLQKHEFETLNDRGVVAVPAMFLKMFFFGMIFWLVNSSRPLHM